MSADMGAGKTRYAVDGETGAITRRRHNDPSWTNTIGNINELAPWALAALLNDAFELGKRERGEMIRQALAG